MRIEKILEKEVGQLSLRRIGSITADCGCDVLVSRLRADLPYIEETELLEHDLLLVVQDCDLIERRDFLVLLRISIIMPVVLYIAERDEISEILGLRAGAADVVFDGMSDRLICERIMATFLRSKNTDQSNNKTHDVHIACNTSILLDVKNRQLLCEDKRVNLTNIEVLLLERILSRDGSVVTRNELSEILEKCGRATHLRSVDSHIKRIRQRIGKQKISFEIIATVYGAGYRLSPEVSWARIQASANGNLQDF